MKGTDLDLALKSRSFEAALFTKIVASIIFFPLTERTASLASAR